MSVKEELGCSIVSLYRAGHSNSDNVKLLKNHKLPTRLYTMLLKCTKSLVVLLIGLAQVDRAVETKCLRLEQTKFQEIHPKNG